MHEGTDRIISRAGLHIMRRCGYHATGVQAVLERAGFPKGSFYHFFKSKERFGERVVADYFDDHRDRVLVPFLEDEAYKPRQRLLNYFSHMCQLMVAGKFTVGCFVGNMALEAADVSPIIQDRVRIIFAEWRSIFSRCIGAAQSQGDISSALPSEQLAEFLLATWEGALLRSKADKSAEPLETFMIVLENKLLCT